MKRFFLTLGIVGLMALSGVGALYAQTIPVNGTTAYTYRTAFTAQELAAAVGIPEDRVLNVNVSASQCQVELARPIRIDRNQVFDQDGNLVEETIIEINELEDWQKKIFDDFLSAAGCGREWRKTVS